MEKPKKINLAYIFLILCVFYIFIDISPYNTHSLFGRALYGIPFIIGGFIGALWLLLSNRIYLTKITKIIIIVSFSVFLIGIFTIPISCLHLNVVYPTYIIGDIASILWLCLAVIAFGVVKNRNEINFKKIYKLYLFLTVVLLLYWIGLGLYCHSLSTPYFIVFSFFLSGAAVNYMFRKKRFYLTTSYLIASFVLLVISFSGRSRAMLLGFLTCSIITFLIISKFPCFKSWIYIFCILALLCVSYNALLVDYFSSTRAYEAIYSSYGIGGASFHERIAEVVNVKYNLLNFWPSIIIGFGHGSVYVYYPNLTDIGSTIRNLTKEGYIHNIHIGPVLLLFRYGILGLILYGLFIFILIKGFFLGRNIYRKAFLDIKLEYFPVRLFYLNYFIYLILFLAFHFSNTLINPFFAISLGITIMFISRPCLLGEKRG